MNILVTGATGFIGRPLCEDLAKKGHKLTILTRNKFNFMKRPAFPCHIFEWKDLEGSQILDKNSSTDLSKFLPPKEAFKDIEAVVHLAGEPLAKAWTDEQKEKIYKSRILRTKNLVRSIEAFGSQVKVLVCASGGAIYGSQGEKEITEDFPLRGNDFLAKLTQDWEESALLDGASNKDSNRNRIRICWARIGLVLHREGSLIKALEKVFRLKSAMALGDGLQWMSWIHRKDVIGMLIYAIENSQVVGAFNATAPRPERNKDLNLSLAQAMKEPFLKSFSVPKSILKAVQGESALLVLSSQKIIPQKIIEWGYSFQFKNLSDALSDLFRDFPKSRVFSEKIWVDQSKEDLENYLERKKLRVLSLKNLKLKKFYKYLIKNFHHEQNLTDLKTADTNTGCFLENKIYYELSLASSLIAADSIEKALKKAVRLCLKINKDK